MKEKHYIKTVEDIKYCEEHNRAIFSDVEDKYYRFHNNVWCLHDECGKLVAYNSFVPFDHVYYYEEEPMQEATTDDVGKLCWMWDTNEEYKTPEILKRVSQKFSYEGSSGSLWLHCRRLSPAEVAEITGYKVEKAE